MIQKYLEYLLSYEMVFFEKEQKLLKQITDQKTFLSSVVYSYAK